MPANLTILIVEDNKTNLMLMEMLIRRLPDCDVLAYDNPMEGAGDLPGLSFDIALIHYQMPSSN